MLCFCGSKLNFQQCCEVFIRGKQLAKTPLQLMRSRFSAYCIPEIDYIFETYHTSQHASNQKQDIELFAKSSHFLKLEIIRCFGTDQLPSSCTIPEVKDVAGFVEFSVSYLQAGKLHQFSECSRFLPELTTPITNERQSQSAVNTFLSDSIADSPANPVNSWQWRYVDGVLNSIPSKSIGRNELCPCGSGKKYKQCQTHQTVK